MLDLFYLSLLIASLKLVQFEAAKDLIDHGPIFDEDECWQDIDLEALGCLLILSTLNTLNFLFLSGKLFNLGTHDPARLQPFDKEVYDNKVVSYLKDGCL